MINDYSHSFFFEHHSIRGVIVRIEESYQTILAQRDYPMSITRFLGEVLLSDILLCTHLKYPGEMTIQMQQEDSPIKMLVAKCNHHLQIRGLASWREGFHDTMLSDHLSAGKLIITMRPTHNHKQYQSVVGINQQPIRKIMEHFFLQSEQVPTRIWMHATDKKAVAILLQQLPSEDLDEANEIWNEVNILTDTLTEHELLSLDSQTLLHRLYSEHDIRLFEPKPIRFVCSCSQSKMEGAILVLGKDEAMHILEEHPVIVVTCEYCQQEFGFSKEHVQTIFGHH